MSTKSTIAHGPSFHLYHEVGDDRYVYLEVEGVPFLAFYDRVVVPVPVHVWEHARRFPGVDLSLADETDKEVRERVEGAVDGRAVAYEEAGTDQQRALADLLGSIPYGSASDPRDEQIARGVEYYGHRRDHKRQVREAIRRLDEERGGRRPPPLGVEAARRALFGAERLLHNLRQDLDPDDPRRELIDERRAECRAVMGTLPRGG